MIEVMRTTEASPERLWALMADVKGWPQWMPTVEAVTPLEPGRPSEVGARYAVEQPQLAKAVWTITAVDPGRSFTWESRTPGLHSVATHELRREADGTTIVLGLTWSGLLAPVVRRLLGARALDYVTQEAASLAARAAATGPDADDAAVDAVVDGADSGPDGIA